MQPSTSEEAIACAVELAGRYDRRGEFTEEELDEVVALENHLYQLEVELSAKIAAEVESS
jgi:hypothetical protein